MLICKYCGIQFHTNNPQKKFCTPLHKDRFWRKNNQKRYRELSRIGWQNRLKKRARMKILGTHYLSKPFELSKTGKRFSILVMANGVEYAKNWYIYGQDQKRAAGIIRDNKKRWKTEYKCG